VVVFEPNPAVHGVLRENLAANGVAGWVDVHGAALGARTGRTRLYASGDTSSLFVAAPTAEPVDVEVVRGDDVVDGRVDVIKLDVEGGELEALRGMTRLVSGARAIFLELNPELLAAAGASSAELLVWLGEHGFAVEWIDEAGGRAASLSEPWSEAYVNLVCRRA
jgi:FkbM family methyltransferase